MEPEPYLLIPAPGSPKTVQHFAFGMLTIVGTVPGTLFIKKNLKNKKERYPFFKKLEKHKGRYPFKKKKLKNLHKGTPQNSFLYIASNKKS